MRPRNLRQPKGGVTSPESSARERQKPPTEEARGPAKGAKDRDGHGGRDSRGLGEAGLAVSQCGRGRIPRRIVAATEVVQRSSRLRRPCQEVYLRLGPLRLSVFSPPRFFAAFCA